MNDFMDTHAPRPEFRAALEQDLVGALRRETRFAPYNRVARSTRIRTVMLIVIGAVLGVGCGYASAQVRESQTRSELLSAAEASLKIASLRVEIAHDRLTRIQRMAEAGVVTRRELTSAESEVRTMELVLAQAQLDIEEIRASSAPPRPELWAPLVSGRDFVRQRLQLRAALTQQHLTDAEGAVKAAEDRLRAGVVGALPMQEAMAGLKLAQQEMADLALQLTLRQQFVEDKIDAATISQRQKVNEVQNSLAILESQSKIAEWRAQLSRERYRVGSGTEIELKRAELDLLELQAKLAQLTSELRAIQNGRKDQ